MKERLIMFTDSHAHLDDERFDEDRQAVIDSLAANGVDTVINIGATMDSSKRSIEFAEKYPFIYAAAGVHPSECSEMTEDDISELTKMLSHKKCVALGEIGLDFHYDFTPKDIQRKWFARQLELAKVLDKPVIIHDREAHAECFDGVKKYGNKGVFHCYSGSAEMAKELVKLGFYVSFTGAVTFKNASKLLLAVEAVPLDRIMIETDCPYMAPVPFRGVRNEPKYVRYVAEKIAEIKGETVESIARITAENTRKLFNF